MHAVADDARTNFLRARTSLVCGEDDKGTAFMMGGKAAVQAPREVKAHAQTDILPHCIRQSTRLSSIDNIIRMIVSSAFTGSFLVLEDQKEQYERPGET